MKKLAESKLFNIILAFIMSISLWFYVTSEINPDYSDTIYNVPVNIINQDVLTGRGLMITEGIEDLTIDLKVYGNRNAISQINSDFSNINVYIDVSDIQTAGQWSLKCSVSLPSTVTNGSVVVEDLDSYLASLTIARVLNKELAVTGSFIGTVDDEHRVEDFIITPSTIEISGPEDLVKEISYAKVTVYADGLDETYSGVLEVDLIDNQGEVVTSPLIQMGVPEVNVVLPVVTTLDLPLTVEFLYGGGITAANFSQYVTYTIDPASISISGEAEDVNPRRDRSHIVGQVDLSELQEEYTFKIVLDSALTNDSGQTEANVTVEVNGLSLRTIETDDIEVIGIPDGMEIETVTQSLQVMIRGPQATLDQLEEYQIRVVADLSDTEIGSAQFTQKVKVYLDGDSSCGVMGTYSIVLKVVE